MVRSPTLVADEVCETNHASPVRRSSNREDALDFMRSKLTDSGLNPTRESTTPIKTILVGDSIDRPFFPSKSLLVRDVGKDPERNSGK